MLARAQNEVPSLATHSDKVALVLWAGGAVAGCAQLIQHGLSRVPVNVARQCAAEAAIWRDKHHAQVAQWALLHERLRFVQPAGARQPREQALKLFGVRP